MFIENTIRDLLNNILEQNDYSVKDKLCKLNELKEKFINLIEETKNKIKLNYDYCPNCKDYYKKEYFKIFYKNREFIHNLNLCDWEPEIRIVNSKFKECPKGHIFLAD